MGTVTHSYAYMEIWGTAEGKVGSPAGTGNDGLGNKSAPGCSVHMLPFSRDPGGENSIGIGGNSYLTSRNLNFENILRAFSARK